MDGTDKNFTNKLNGRMNGLCLFNGQIRKLNGNEKFFRVKKKKKESEKILNSTHV